MMPLCVLSQDIDTLTSEQVHTSTKEVLEEMFSEFEINGYRYSSNEVWDVLLYASVNHMSIKSACESLDDVPSENWMYTTLKEELLQSHTLDDLEQHANDALQVAFPKRLTQRSQKVAIDLVLIPYYGKEATDGIRRSKAKKSTTKFFCYASAYLIKKNKRVTLCFTYVRPEDTLLGVLTRLLERLQALGLHLKRLYLDRAFAQVDVLDYLQQQTFVSIVALPKKGDTLKSLQRGKRSYTTEYTMRSPKYGEITFPLWIACRYRKGKAKKHGVEYLFFAVLGECKSPVLQVAQEYRHRFGIESSYRIMNQTRANTTSKNPMLRLLLVAIAFLLANIWVWCKWNIRIITHRRHKQAPDFTLNMFCLFVEEQIKTIYGILNEIKL